MNINYTCRPPCHQHIHRILSIVNVTQPLFVPVLLIVTNLYIMPFQLLRVTFRLSRKMFAQSQCAESYLKLASRVFIGSLKCALGFGSNVQHCTGASWTRLSDVDLGRLQICFYGVLFQKKKEWVNQGNVWDAVTSRVMAATQPST